MTNLNNRKTGKSNCSLKALIIFFIILMILGLMKFSLILFFYLAIIALVVCHVTSYVASTISNSNQDHAISEGHPKLSSLEHELEGIKVCFLIIIITIHYKYKQKVFHTSDVS